MKTLLVRSFACYSLCHWCSLLVSLRSSTLIPSLYTLPLFFSHIFRPSTTRSISSGLFTHSRTRTIFIPNHITCTRYLFHISSFSLLLIRTLLFITLMLRLALFSRCMAPPSQFLIFILAGSDSQDVCEHSSECCY